MSALDARSLDRNPARPADKGTNSHGIDPALIRRTVDGLVSLSAASGKPMRRKQARAVVVAYASDHGPELDGWSSWLRNWHGIADPTGETAVRNVSRGRGGLHGTT